MPNLNNYDFSQVFRDSDSLVNATELTKAYYRNTGKRKDVRDWLVTKEAKDSIAYLERVTGIPVSSLVIVEHGVGTWFHPDLAEIFAQWVSVEYRFVVVALIRDAKENKLGKCILKPLKFEEMFSGDKTWKEIRQNSRIVNRQWSGLLMSIGVSDQQRRDYFNQILIAVAGENASIIKELLDSPLNSKDKMHQDSLIEIARLQLGIFNAVLLGDEVGLTTSEAIQTAKFTGILSKSCQLLLPKHEQLALF